MSSKFNRLQGAKKLLPQCKPPPDPPAPIGTIQPPTLSASVRFNGVGPPGATRTVSFFFPHLALTPPATYFGSQASGGLACDVTIAFNWTTGQLAVGSTLYSPEETIASLGATPAPVPPKSALDATIETWTFRIPDQQSGRAKIWA